MQMENEITRRYEDPGDPTAFSGINNLQKQYKRSSDISSESIRRAVSSLDSYTLHRETKQVLEFFLSVNNG